MYVELPESRLSTVHEVISDAKGQMDLACQIKYAVDTKTGQLKTLEEAEELGTFELFPYDFLFSNMYYSHFIHIVAL